MKLSMVEAIKDALDIAMDRDEKVMLLGEDIGKNGGMFRATEGLLDIYGTERVVDTPLAESGIIGSAIGLAVSGMKPVCEIQFMGFLYPGFDQIISHASRLRNRTRGALSCPMVIRMPYGGGVHALEHHSESTEAILAHTPGIKVVIPSTAVDAKGLLIASIEDPDPVIFLEPKKLYRSFKEEVKEGHYAIPIGKARIVQEGTDITVFCWGSMVQTAENAVEGLDLSVEIIDLRTISPVDISAIVKSVEKTGRAVIVHEAPKTCGFGAEISALINEKCLLSLKAPVKRVAGFDTIFPLSKLEDKYMPSVERVRGAIKEVVEF